MKSHIDHISDIRARMSIEKFTSDGLKESRRNLIEILKEYNFTPILVRSKPKTS